MKTLLEGIIEGFIREEPEQEHKPGDVWQTDGGDWAGMRIRDGETEWGFSDRERALAWVNGQDVAPADKEKPKRQPTGGEEPTAQATTQDIDKMVDKAKAAGELPSEPPPKDGGKNIGTIGMSPAALKRQAEKQREKIRSQMRRSLSKINDFGYLPKQIARQMRVDERSANVAMTETKDGLRGKVKHRNAWSREVLKTLPKGVMTDSLTRVDWDGEKRTKTIQEWFDQAKAIRDRNGGFDLGLGTDQSRAGETSLRFALNSAARFVAENKQSFADASDEEKQELTELFLDGLYENLMEVANRKGAFLDESWVNSTLGSFRSIIDHPTIGGIENISHVGWDTEAGKAATNSTEHKTSADVILMTKDGRRVGISLKKDFNVFIMNYGLEKTLNRISDSMREKGVSEETVAEIEQKVGLERYNQDVAEQFTVMGRELSTVDIDKLVKLCKKDPQRCKIDGNDISRLSLLKGAVEKAKAGARFCGRKKDEGCLSGDEKKILYRIARSQGSDVAKEAYQKFTKASDTHLGRLFEAAQEHPELNTELQDIIIDGLHLAETLGSGLGDGLDSFISVFGPLGASAKRFSGDRGSEARKGLMGTVMDQDTVLSYISDPSERKQLQQLISSGEENRIRQFLAERINLSFDEATENALISFRRSTETLENENELYRFLPLATLNYRSRGGEAPSFEAGVAPALKLTSLYGADLEQWDESVIDQFRDYMISVGRSVTQESAPPELRKLIRDIALWKLGKYGN